MKTKVCEACKQIGKDTTGHHVEEIYHLLSAPTYIRLCYSHSVELFKSGQVSFYSRYKMDVPVKVTGKELFESFHNYFGLNSFR
jgi:uncharacterized protein YktA (UPF0223 family)